MGAYLWMLNGALTLAVMSSLAHALRHYCDWPVIASFRAGLSLVFTLLLAGAGGVPLVYFRPATLWTRSLAGSISLACGFCALTRLPVADFLAITHMFPIWVAILSWPMLRQVPSREVWLATGLGLVGVALIQQPHLAAGNWATLLAIVSSFTSAVALIGLHQLQGIDARAVVVHFSAVSLVVCLVAMAIFPSTRWPWYSEINAAALVLLVAMGVFGTIGQICLTKAFAAGEPAKVSIVGLSQVGFGVLLDAAVFGRVFTPLAVAGIVLVVTPTVWLLVRREPGPAEAV